MPGSTRASRAETHKARLLRAAYERAGLSQREIAERINDRYGTGVSATEVSFALVGRMGRHGDVYHGMGGDGVSRLVAKVLRVTKKDLEAAHKKDLADDQQQRTRKGLGEGVASLPAGARREITQAIRNGASLDEAIRRYLGSAEDAG